jgi:hypothetical protein
MKRLALFLAGALVIGPAPAFVVAEDGHLDLDPRETQMVATICQGAVPVCTFFHFARLQFEIGRLAQKAYDDGKAAGLAETCKGT